MIRKTAERGLFGGEYSAETDRKYQKTVDSGRRFMKEGPEDVKINSLVTIFPGGTSAKEPIC